MFVFYNSAVKLLVLSIVFYCLSLIMHINGNIHIGMNILMIVSILINILVEFWLIAREPMPTR